MLVVLCEAGKKCEAEERKKIGRNLWQENDKDGKERKKKRKRCVLKAMCEGEERKHTHTHTLKKKNYAK